MGLFSGILKRNSKKVEKSEGRSEDINKGNNSVKSTKDNEEKTSYKGPAILGVIGILLVAIGFKGCRGDSSQKNKKDKGIVEIGYTTENFQLGKDIIPEGSTVVNYSNGIASVATIDGEIYNLNKNQAAAIVQQTSFYKSSLTNNTYLKKQSGFIDKQLPNGIPLTILPSEEDTPYQIVFDVTSGEKGRVDILSLDLQDKEFPLDNLYLISTKKGFLYTTEYSGENNIACTLENNSFVPVIRNDDSGWGTYLEQTDKAAWDYYVDIENDAEWIMEVTPDGLQARTFQEYLDKNSIEKEDDKNTDKNYFIVGKVIEDTQFDNGAFSKSKIKEGSCAITFGNGRTIIVSTDGNILYPTNEMMQKLSIAIKSTGKVEPSKRGTILLDEYGDALRDNSGNLKNVASMSEILFFDDETELVKVLDLETGNMGYLPRTEIKPCDAKRYTSSSDEEITVYKDDSGDFFIQIGESVESGNISELTDLNLIPVANVKLKGQKIEVTEKTDQEKDNESKEEKKSDETENDVNENQNEEKKIVSWKRTLQVEINETKDSGFKSQKSKKQTFQSSIKNKTRG